MSFYCEYWDRPLDDVSEHQSDVCMREEHANGGE